MRDKSNRKNSGIILFIILLLSAIIITFLIRSIINKIILEGFSDIYFYFMVVFFILLSLIIYFSFIRISFNILKTWTKNDISYFNNYLYLSLSITFLTLFLGYYYIQIFSENKLTDFLLVLSIAFINSFAAVSALKHITKIR